MQAVLLEPLGVAHNGVESIDVKGQVSSLHSIRISQKERQRSLLLVGGRA